MKILITGGSDLDDYILVRDTLDKYHQDNGISCLVHGGARGADSMGGLWAKSQDIQVEVYEAQWSTHGRAAGPIRNKQMLMEGKPDVLIAFPGGGVALVI